VNLFLVACLLGLALSSCADDEGAATDPGAASSPTTSAPNAGPGSPTAGQSGDPLVDTGPAPGTSSDAVAAAQNAFATWARPDLSYEQWWAALQPLMNGQGRQDYADTDPAEIPRLEFTDVATVVEDAPTSALVDLPTSLGTFQVRLSRTDPSVGWLVSRFYCPAPTAPAPTAPLPTGPALS